MRELGALVDAWPRRAQGGQTCKEEKRRQGRSSLRPGYRAAASDYGGQPVPDVAVEVSGRPAGSAQVSGHLLIEDDRLGGEERPLDLTSDPDEVQLKRNEDAACWALAIEHLTDALIEVGEVGCYARAALAQPRGRLL